MVRKVTSTSKDEVSVVSAEFEYEKGLDSAATDVANALSKVTAQAASGDSPSADIQDQSGHTADHDDFSISKERQPGGSAEDSRTSRQSNQGRTSQAPQRWQRRGLRELISRRFLFRS